VYTDTFIDSLRHRSTVEICFVKSLGGDVQRQSRLDALLLTVELDYSSYNVDAGGAL